jgi:hypothetical protein
VPAAGGWNNVPGELFLDDGAGLQCWHCGRKIAAMFYEVVTSEAHADVDIKRACDAVLANRRGARAGSSCNYTSFPSTLRPSICNN